MHYVDIQDASFEVPDWISLKEFVEGFISNDPEEPLSSLISSKLYRENRGEGYTETYRTESDHDVFELEFLVPFGELRELSLNRFRIVKVDSEGVSLPTENVMYSIHENGIRVKFLADGLFDVNDIQVFAAPTDSFFEEISELKKNFKSDDFLGYARNEIEESFPNRDKRWLQHYWSTLQHDGKEWTVYLNVHQD